MSYHSSFFGRRHQSAASDRVFYNTGINVDSQSSCSDTETFDICHSYEDENSVGNTSSLMFNGLQTRRHHMEGLSKSSSMENNNRYIHSQQQSHSSLTMMNLPKYMVIDAKNNEWLFVDAMSSNEENNPSLFIKNVLCSTNNVYPAHESSIIQIPINENIDSTQTGYTLYANDTLSLSSKNDTNIASEFSITNGYNNVIDNEQRSCNEIVDNLVCYPVVSTNFITDNEGYKYLKGSMVLYNPNGINVSVLHDICASYDENTEIGEDDDDSFGTCDVVYGSMSQVLKDCLYRYVVSKSRVTG